MADKLYRTPFKSIDEAKAAAAKLYVERIGPALAEAER